MPHNSCIVLIYGLIHELSVVWVVNQKALGSKAGSLHSVRGPPHLDTMAICWPLGPWAFGVFCYLGAVQFPGSRHWLRALPLVRPPPQTVLLDVKTMSVKMSSSWCSNVPGGWVSGPFCGHFHVFLFLTCCPYLFPPGSLRG